MYEAEYISMEAIGRGSLLKANILSESPISGRRISDVFFADVVGFKVGFLEISQCLKHPNDA